MNPITDLLTDYGFTKRTALLIAHDARAHGLTPDHVTAWIAEAQSSTSLTNPLGFLRSRLSRGDKPPLATLTRGPHITTQTCTCGRVVPATHICPDCNLCPTCCTCDLPDPQKETNMNITTTTQPDPLTYALNLIGTLSPALLNRTTALDRLTASRNRLAQQICTGRPHWRDKNTQGKTAKLYVLHSTDQSCPIHGTPEPGARLRVYVGNKPTLVADALAAIERTTEHQDLQRELTAIHTTLTSITYWLKSCYRELDYLVPDIHEHRSPHPRPPLDNPLTKEF